MPTTRTIEETVYQFDELTDRAKDRARDWYRESVSADFGDFGAESVLEDASTVADILGIRISSRTVPLMSGKTRQEPTFYWEVGSYRGTDGACFTGSYSYAKGSCKAIREYAPQDKELARIADALREAQQPYYYRLQASIDRNGYTRDNGPSSMNVECEYDGPDYRVVDEGTVDDVQEAIRDFAGWIGDRLTAEWEYQHSDEAVDENIMANEYEFDEDGNRA